MVTTSTIVVIQELTDKAFVPRPVMCLCYYSYCFITTTFFVWSSHLQNFRNIFIHRKSNELINGHIPVLVELKEPNPLLENIMNPVVSRAMAIRGLHCHSNRWQYSDKKRDHYWRGQSEEAQKENPILKCWINLTQKGKPTAMQGKAKQDWREDACRE